jgi:transcriptional regulator with XRE-family HTH domain
MTSQNGRAFNEWLRGQLKAKKMSQRQLAQQSGVDHSTISRLIRGDRMPSLGTATKLARGLRELREDADTPAYLGLVSSGTTNPTARVEYALRADDLLTEPQVRQIMEYYLAVRMRRYGRAYQGEGGATATGSPAGERGTDHALRPTSSVTTSVTSAHPAPGSSRPFAGGVETRTTGPAISTIATVRPVAGSTSRERGRY